MKQHGNIKLKWSCGHIEGMESAAWKECPSCMQKRIDVLEDRIDSAADINHRLRSWCHAYPYEVFIEVTEPDWKKANKVLADAGISMTAMNGSNMRHVITGVKDIPDDLDKALDP
jgi:hypothetical protein